MYNKKYIIIIIYIIYIYVYIFEFMYQNFNVIFMVFIFNYQFQYYSFQENYIKLSIVNSISNLIIGRGFCYKGLTMKPDNLADSFVEKSSSTSNYSVIIGVHTSLNKCVIKLSEKGKVTECLLQAILLISWFVNFH